MDDISDDEEDPYEDEDEEDIDLEADSEGEEDMPPKIPSKRATPSKPRKTPSEDSTTGEDLPSRMSDMALSNAPMFSMDFQLPFILSVFNEQLDQMVKVEVLVPTLPKEFFLPDIISGGKKMEVSIQVPPFFVDEGRVIASNAGVAGFNQNTHQAQAFKDQCEVIHESNGMKNTIFGKPMEIAMPFVCEERIVDWEIQAYRNELGNLTDDLGQEQFHAVLVVIARKLRNKRKTTGGFRVIGGAGINDENLG